MKNPIERLNQIEMRAFGRSELGEAYKPEVDVLKEQILTTLSQEEKNYVYHPPTGFADPHPFSIVLLAKAREAREKAGGVKAKLPEGALLKKIFVGRGFLQVYPQTGRRGET